MAKISLNPASKINPFGQSTEYKQMIKNVLNVIAKQKTIFNNKKQSYEAIELTSFVSSTQGRHYLDRFLEKLGTTEVLTRDFQAAFLQAKILEAINKEKNLNLLTTDFDTNQEYAIPTIQDTHDLIAIICGSLFLDDEQLFIGDKKG